MYKRGCERIGNSVNDNNRSGLPYYDQHFIHAVTEIFREVEKFTFEVELSKHYNL